MSIYIDNTAPWTPHDLSTTVLAPRSINVPSRMSVDQKSGRRIKQAPVKTQQQLREQRNQQHFSKVRDRRDKAQFERRADDILRSDFLRHKRDWEKEQEACTSKAYGFEEEEQHEQFQSSDNMALSQDTNATAELEQQEEQELRELEALLDLLPGEDDPRWTYNSDQHLEHSTHDDYSEHFGSDDSDIEFQMSQIMQEMSDTTTQSNEKQENTTDEMDLT